jgi:hypothetical protein
MSDLVASRVKGSERQLFGREDDDFNDEFLVRPAATRKVDGLAAILGNLHEFAAEIINKQPQDECLESFVHSDDPASIKDFQQRFMSKDRQVPCLLTRSTLRADWPAGALRWHPRTLLKSLGGSTRVEMKGSNATVTLDEFVAYVESAGCGTDDDPCYLWETLDDADPLHDFLISKFIVPGQFRGADPDLVHGIHVPGDESDLLSYAGDDGLMFGLHRWLLVGPGRSGSSLHVDPLFTSAWNTLLLGTKLWCVIPPSAYAEGMLDSDA